MNKKMLALNKEMFKLEDGKVFIESEELANAIQNNQLDLFVEEEAAGVADLELDDGGDGKSLLCC